MKIKKIIKKIINTLLIKFGHSIVHNQYLLALEKNLIVEEMSDEEKNLSNNISKFTGTMAIPIWTLINAIKYVSEKKIEGDFVEAGVWKGGNIIIYNELRKKYKLSNEIFAYDTFEGMPQPSKYDMNWKNVLGFTRYKMKDGDWCKCSLEDVKKNILSISKSLNGIKFIKGLVENTLLIEDNLPKKISILRLDTDFYESTKVELEILYPRLVNGGILIIDDYGAWKGCRKAVDDYFKNKEFLIYVDHGCRLYIKNSDRHL